jgi:hypothetical protein
MSHFTKTKTKIKSVSALKDAVKELGLELIEKGVARGYANNKIEGDYVIKLRGPYDVALQKQQDGSYAIVTDWWEGHVAKEIGRNGEKLLQAYSVALILQTARMNGQTVKKSIREDGTVHLTLTSYR